MGCKFLGGAELQKAGSISGYEFTSLIGCVTSTTQKKSGAASWYCAGPNENAQWWRPAEAAWADEVRLKFDIYVTALTSNRNAWLGALTSANATDRRRRLYIGSAGANQASFAIYNQTGTVIGGTGVIGFTLNTWHRIEWYYKRVASGLSTDQIKIDGTLYDLSGANGSPDASQIKGFEISTVDPDSKSGTNINYYIDDIVIFDSSGSYNNTWPGLTQLKFAVPNGDVGGSYNEWINNQGAPGSYVYWDEWPTDLTDYNLPDAVNDSQLSDFQDCATIGIQTYDTIVAAMLRAAHEAVPFTTRCKFLAREGSDTPPSGPAVVGPETWTGGDSAQQAPATVWRMDTTPVSAVAWTPTLWDAMEFGGECTVWQAGQNQPVSSLGCYVAYVAGTPPAAGGRSQGYVIG